MDLSEASVEDFKRAFKRFDLNGDGVISLKQMRAAMKELGHTPTEIQLQEMVQEADLDNDGCLNFDEFIEMMSKTVRDEETEVKTMEAFKVFDRDGSGVIRISELKHILMNLGEPINEEEADDLLRLAEEDDGLIDYVQFVKSIFK